MVHMTAIASHTIVGTFKQMVEDIRLLTSDEALRQEMGENGTKYVKQEHDTKKIVEQYVELSERSWREK